MVASNKGFTLVELMVAVMLFAVGMLGLLGVNTLVTRLLGSGDRAATGTFHGQQRLETLHATRCEDIVAGTDTVDGTYDLTWTVEPAYNDNVRRLRLTNTYTRRPGSITVDSLETSVLCGP